MKTKSNSYGEQRAAHFADVRARFLLNKAVEARLNGRDEIARDYAEEAVDYAERRRYLELPNELWNPPTVH